MQNFFTAGGYIPHGHCYLWQTGLVGLHVLSDSLIAIAYYSIPLTLVYFVRQRQDLPFHQIFLLFGAFIVACGTTHILGIWTLWHPDYWLSGLVKASTALISVYAAIALVSLLPQMLALPSPIQLETANIRLEQEIAERDRIELALSESEECFRNAFDYAVIGKALIATDGRWLKVNRSICEIVGYTERELLNLTFQAITHPEDLEIDLDFVRQMLAGEIRTYQMEKRYFHKFGQIVWVLLSVSLVRNARGEPLYFISQIQDISDRKRAEQQQIASLQEKEVLLKEIHHRVKNNLQIVSSLLRLQCRRLQDERAIESLLESQNRIKSIALVHEKLYRSDNLSKIDFAQYISSLAASILSSYQIRNERIILETQVEPISLDIDRAIPCGLIVNELISNCIKYAFPSNYQGYIQLKLQTNYENIVTLIISDNGIGISEKLDFSLPISIGWQLVQGFVNQLKGKINLDNSKGTSIEINFPLK